MADIHHCVPIAAKPEAIYPLISTGKGLTQWWAADVTEPQSSVELGFFNRSTVYRVRLMIDKSPTEADWLVESGAEWIDTHLHFRLQENKSGTVLNFSHDGWRSQSEYFVMCNTTWGELMYRLKATAEGKSRGPLFLAADLAY